MWRYLTTIDLFPQIEYWNLPVDDPLVWKVPDHRRIKRKRWDALYLRMLDVAQALEARSYAADGIVRLDVDDPFLPDEGGRFELAIVDGAGQDVPLHARECERWRRVHGTDGRLRALLRPSMLKPRHLVQEISTWQCDCFSRPLCQVSS